MDPWFSLWDNIGEVANRANIIPRLEKTQPPGAKRVIENETQAAFEGDGSLVLRLR